MRVVLLTVLVACGSGDRVGPTEPKPTTVDCAGAAASSAALADEPSREAVRAVVAIRCTEDRWSPAAAACIAGAKNREAGHDCVFRELTGEQAEHLMHEVRDAIDTSLTPADTAAPPPDDETGLILTELYPSRGAPAGGTFVVLRGARFTDEERTAKVRFGDVEATVVRIPSDSELVVTSPPGAGTVDVVVTFTPGGERVLPGAFTYATEKPRAKVGGAEAQLAAAANKAGETLMQKKDYERAAEKFRDAAARSSEPLYFLNLCGAYYHADRFDEALAACQSVLGASPTTAQATRADALIATIQAEARRLGVGVSPAE